MSILKKIYLSPVGLLVSLIQNILSIFTRPFMVYGYYSKSQKKFLRSTRISSTATIISPLKLEIGNQCWIWHHSIIDASNGVKIGTGVQIGAFVGVFTHSSHVSIRLLGSEFINHDSDDRVGYVRSPVSIGDYTFIAAGSIIMPGTSIGKGCVIGAGSVVKGNIPDFSIVSGNPGKVIGDTGKLDLRYLKRPGVESTYFDPVHFQDLIKSRDEKSVGDE